MNRLQEIAGNRRRLIATEKEDRSDSELLARLDGVPAPRGFHRALTAAPRTIIAEIKRASPSAGEIRPGAGAADIADRYARAGAAALSVLTEPDYFGGHLDDLVAAREATALPALRKDFVIDRWQLADSRAAGADAVLLIVALLGTETGAYLEAASDLGLDALIEVHDEAELDIAVEAGGQLIGINNRDLRDLTIDLAVFERLAPRAPNSVTLVAESGVKTPEDARRMFDAGARTLLVGSSLMAAADPGEALAALISSDSGGPQDVDQGLRDHAV